MVRVLGLKSTLMFFKLFEDLMNKEEAGLFGLYKERNELYSRKCVCV